jgi:hypothetical protein
VERAAHDEIAVVVNEDPGVAAVPHIYSVVGQVLEAAAGDDGGELGVLRQLPPPPQVLLAPP